MDADPRADPLQARLKHAEIVQLKRHAVQVLIDSLDDGESDMSAYYRARDKMDALYDVAERCNMTKSKLIEELDQIWETMRVEAAQA